MFSPLARKALRDLWHLRGQALAIVLIVAAGIANLVMATSTLDSLFQTRKRFYQDSAFADVWASLKRAPESLLEQVRRIDGVQTAESRIQMPAQLSIPLFEQPVKAIMLSLPEDRAPLLNRLYLRAGRLPAAAHEVVVSEGFAQAHGFRPGSKLGATIVGRSQSFRIVGIVLSPEYVYQIQPGAAFPDFKRFAVVWMTRRALEAAADMDGAFNQLCLRLRPGIEPRAVTSALDRLLARFGGLGAYPRVDQLSHRFLDGEFDQLRAMSVLFPTVFLAVAAFLLNVVLSRLIGMQRDQVAILKAFGYGNAAIARHFASFVLLIVAAGTGVGVWGGVVMGQWMSGVYREFYRFPFLDYQLSPGVIAMGVGVSAAAALLGTFQAVRRAALMPPAEAMRPPTPEKYRITAIERLPLLRRLRQPTRMIFRSLARRPFKALMTLIGLAFAGAIMMMGRFQNDALSRMIDVQYRLGQRNDLSVDFTEITPRRALFELLGVDGVRRAEPYRNTPVRLHFAQRSWRTSLQGLPADGTLKRPVDIRLRPVPIPARGLLLTDWLAEWLGARVGDPVEIEVLEGRRRRVEVTLVGVVNEYLGVQAYMALDAMNLLLGDGDVISGAYLAVDHAREMAVFRALEARPRVAGIGVRRLAIENFYATLAESILVFTFMAMILGGVINFGVIYNSARVALSERGRELASLRVLGFGRFEVSYILLGELSVLVLASMPLAALVGLGLCWLFAHASVSDLYRIPVYISTRTYAFAVLCMLFSTVASAWLVRRRIDRLDLIEVLKTRE